MCLSISGFNDLIMTYRYSILSWHIQISLISITPIISGLVNDFHNTNNFWTCKWFYGSKEKEFYIFRWYFCWIQIFLFNYGKSSNRCLKVYTVVMRFNNLKVKKKLICSNVLKKHLDIVTNVIQFKIQFHSMGILFKSDVITWLITKLIKLYAYM